MINTRQRIQDRSQLLNRFGALDHQASDPQAAAGQAIVDSIRKAAIAQMGFTDQMERGGQPNNPFAQSNMRDFSPGTQQAWQSLVQNLMRSGLMNMGAMQSATNGQRSRMHGNAMGNGSRVGDLRRSERSRWSPGALSNQFSSHGSASGKSEISDKAISLIRRSEGYDQPGKHPGGASGVTIGVGYDLGHKSKAEFRRDWAGKLPASTMRRLERVIGLKGSSARRATRGLRDIRIPKNAADQVFAKRTLPKWIDRTRRAFPGFDKLNKDQKGALVSLSFNRGTSMRGGRRREMRAIRDAVRRGDLRSVSRQFRSMKRLWRGRRLNGLITRREREAKLFDGRLA